MSNVYSIKTKKLLSPERVKFQSAVKSCKSDATAQKEAQKPDDVPAGSLIVTGVSGNQYALPEKTLREIFSGDRLVSAMGDDVINDLFPTILYEWLCYVEQYTGIEE